jgi:uncharacterized protein YndB with AHSA1/START domain
MTIIKSPIKVTVIRRFYSAPERVFDAWLDTEMIAQWMFGPGVRDEEIVRLTTDPRIGGSFSFLVRRKGGEIDHVGTYLEIERSHRLVFTWGIGEAEPSRVTVEIARCEAGCELKLTHELHPDWADYADRTKAAWQKMIEALFNRLENGSQR